MLNLKMAGYVAGNLLMALGLGIFTFTYMPILYSEVMYRINPPQNNNYVEVDNTSIKIDEDVEDESENIQPLKAINPDFSVIIPKIGVNAPIKAQVSTVNETEYMNALRDGVAHAKGTSLPGENGNIFLFAHSSLNFWQLGAYATVFNLLNKMENGDYVVIAYKGDTYVYKVFSSEVIPGWNTEPFFQSYEESVITLVTCYPPGATVNRLVVKARLVQSDISE